MLLAAAQQFIESCVCFATLSVPFLTAESMEIAIIFLIAFLVSQNFNLDSPERLQFFSSAARAVR
jgi:hypothetical protein